MSDSFQPNPTHLDKLCDEFDRAWRTAGPATPGRCLEDCLDRVAAEDRLALLHRLLEVEIRYRSQRGERFDIADYQQRFRDLPHEFVARELRTQALHLEPDPGVTEAPSAA